MGLPLSKCDTPLSSTQSPLHDLYKLNLGGIGYRSHLPVIPGTHRPNGRMSSKPGLQVWTLEQKNVSEIKFVMYC